MNLFVETERLILREILYEDDIDMFALYSTSEILKYLPDKPIKNIDEAREIITFIQNIYYTSYSYEILRIIKGYTLILTSKYAVN